MQNNSCLSVCHIISGDLWAGAEVMAHHLLRNLLRFDDIILTVIVLNDGELSRKIKDLGIDLHILNEGNTSFRRLVRDIRGIIKKNRVDIIHTHRYKENLLGYLASRFCRDVQLIATQHGLPELSVNMAKIKSISKIRLNFLLLSQRFDRVVAVSEGLAGELKHRYGIRPEIVKVIHNGIDFPETEKKRKQSGAFVIGSAGRLFPVKDYPLMVNIAKSVLGKMSTVRFEIAGDGPEFARLAGLIENSGLSGVFLLKGFISDLEAFYSGLDLYLSTSFYEGIPMSVLEAMTCGLPVIAPKVGGFSEILTDGVEGYLIDGRDSETYAKKCLLLAEDDNLRERMSLSARKRITSHFSAGSMAEEYRELYKSTVDLKQRTSSER